LFPFIGKEALNLIELLSVTGHFGNSNLLRYASENRFSQSVVTGKWLVKNKI
jgi:hypothetical protein